MGKIKTSLQHFRQWQRDSLRHVTSTPSSDTHHCHCCDNDYTGNYCPTCGQRAGAKHLTWNSVRSGIMDVWGVGSRSLPYTLWQLLLRPGYLIADYINGRRQVSFPPVKMLVIVALVVFLLNSLINPNDFTTINNDTEFILHFRFLNWLSHHYDWAAMFFCSFLIIPTHLIHDWMRLKPLLLVNLPKYSLLLAVPLLLSAWINKRHTKGKRTHDQQETDTQPQ